MITYHPYVKIILLFSFFSLSYFCPCLILYIFALILLHHMLVKVSKYNSLCTKLCGMVRSLSAFNKSSRRKFPASIQFSWNIPRRLLATKHIFGVLCSSHG